MAIGTGHGDVHLLSPLGRSFAQSDTGWLCSEEAEPLPAPHPQAHLGKQRLLEPSPCCCPRAGVDGHLLLWNSTAPIKLQLRSGPRPGLESGCSETLRGHGVCSAADGLREPRAAEVPGPGVELPTIPSCTPGGADPSSPDLMLMASPTPSKAQVVLDAEDPKPRAHRGLGAPFATPPHLRNAERAFPATPGPVWATVLGTLAAAVAHPRWGRGHAHPGRAHCWGRQEWDASTPGGRVHKNENPSRAAGLGPGTALLLVGVKPEGSTEGEGPVCARSSGPTPRTTASMAGPRDPFHERKRSQHPVSAYCVHRLS